MQNTTNQIGESENYHEMDVANFPIQDIDRRETVKINIPVGASLQGSPAKFIHPILQPANQDENSNLKE